MNPYNYKPQFKKVIPFIYHNIPIRQLILITVLIVFKEKQNTTFPNTAIRFLEFVS